MKLWQIGLVSVGAGITLPAVAQLNWGPQTRTEVEAQVKERLGKFDTNKDGIVSPDEMKAFADARAKSRADERFAAMDTNNDGSISRAEFDAARTTLPGMGERIMRIEHMRGPDGAKPPMLPLHEGALKGPQRAEHIRLMMGDGGAMMMADGTGKGIVIADAVKQALARFDATDTNKDGTISPEERKAGRDAMRAKMRTMVAPTS
ncbi:MAG: EF-hand domain-containing protein [Sphingomonadales bacterium]